MIKTKKGAVLIIVMVIMQLVVILSTFILVVAVNGAERGYKTINRTEENILIENVAHGFITIDKTSDDFKKIFINNVEGEKISKYYIKINDTKDELVLYNIEKKNFVLLHIKIDGENRVTSWDIRKMFDDTWDFKSTKLWDS